MEAENLNEAETDDILQVYIRDLDSPWETPHPHLAAFCRVHFSGAEKKTVRLPLAHRCFTVVDSDGRRFHDGSHFEIFAGFSQPDARSIELTGKRPVRLEYTVPKNPSAN